MARCSGCTSPTIHHEDTSCITLTGVGSSDDPLTATFDTDCAGGGGGDCAQKNLYTVATTGLTGLGIYLGTPEPFLSCADFIGDGINDQVAINAACTAALGIGMGGPEVYLNSGIYVIQDSISALGVPIRGVPGAGVLGTRSMIVNDAAASGFPMIIDSPNLSDLTVGALLASNAGATVQMNTAFNVDFERCVFTNWGLGSDSGVLEFNDHVHVTIRDCHISCGDGTSIAKPGTYFNPTAIGIIRIVHNNFVSCTIDVNNMSQGSHIKDNNIQYPGGGPTVADRGAINLIHMDTNVAISNWQVNDNIISNVSGHGIYIDGKTNGFFAWAQVHNNLIYGYGHSGTNQFDGIFLVGNVDDLSIQGNKCTQPGAGARHGINISAATCNDNFVTNNDLFQSGGGASLNNAGTGTITVAGNRL